MRAAASGRPKGHAHDRHLSQEGRQDPRERIRAGAGRGGRDARPDRGRGRGGGAGLCADARQVGRPHRRHARGDRGTRGTRAAAGARGHRLRGGTGAHLRAGAARLGPGLRDHHAFGADGRAALGALQRGGLLRAHGALCAYRLGHHVGRDGQGGGRADRGGLFHTLPGRGHAPLRALCHARGGGRHRADAGRRAGGGEPSLRALHRQAGRRDRGAGQQVRGRGQADALRQGGHRRLRRAVRNRHHRRRDGRCRDRGERPRGAGRARA
jgi:hypothetical protein